MLSAERNDTSERTFSAGGFGGGKTPRPMLTRDKSVGQTTAGGNNSNFGLVCCACCFFDGTRSLCENGGNTYQK